jgi:hypothetical protein
MIESHAGTPTLWLVGRLGSGEALQLIEATRPTVRFLCSTTALAAATTMALMFTLLSVSLTHDHDFRPQHYSRIRRIAQYSVVCLILSIFVLLLQVVPLVESEKVPVQKYMVLYYTIVVSSSLLGGLSVAIMLMLYDAIASLIEVAHPELDSSLLRTDGDEEDRDSQATAGS